MPIQPFKCVKCGCTFNKYWSKSQRVPKYCSLACSLSETSLTGKEGSATRFTKGHTPHNVGTRVIQKFKCEECGKRCKRYLPPGRAPYRFCKDHRPALEGHPNWKGGKPFISDAGYVVVVGPNGKRIYEHKLIGERVVGRKLTKHEHVHHLNGIKHENVNGNLLVCSSGYHRMIERMMCWIYQLEHFGGRTHEQAVNEAHEMLQKSLSSIRDKKKAKLRQASLFDKELA